MILNLKLFKLRLRILFNSLTGKIKKNLPAIELSSSGHLSRKILIIFPFDEPSFRVASYSFRNLRSHNIEHNEYTFVAVSRFSHMFHFQRGNTILIDTDRKKRNKIVNEESLLSQLEITPYDMIVDLNSDFNLDIARILSHLSASLKVGFKSKFSDLFYNIQLDISNKGITEKGFQRIHIMLSGS